MTLQHPGDFETGLEDFNISDAVIPRITIAHKDAEFEDSLSKERFGSIKVIILGLVKQRVLWHQIVDDDDRPMCRSLNFETGFPNVSDEQPKDKRFPWAKAGFDPDDYPEDDNGVIRTPCGSCALKEWGSHPDGKRPYCSEQFTLPVLYDPEGDGNFVPAIITFQKTGLKPLKAYLSSFARSRNAAFMAVTEIGLTPMKKGQTDYAVPTFRKVENTEEESWREYSTQYRDMRDFLTADPTPREDVDGDTPAAVSDNVAKPPAKKPQQPTVETEDIVDGEVVEESTPEPKVEPKETPQPKVPPKPAAPAAEADDDDELPF